MHTPFAGACGNCFHWFAGCCSFCSRCCRWHWTDAEDVSGSGSAAKASPLGTGHRTRVPRVQAHGAAAEQGHWVTFTPFCLFLKPSQSTLLIPPQLILVQHFAFWRRLAFERFICSRAYSREGAIFKSLGFLQDI